MHRSTPALSLGFRWPPRRKPQESAEWGTVVPQLHIELGEGFEDELVAIRID